MGCCHGCCCCSPISWALQVFLQTKVGEALSSMSNQAADPIIAIILLNSRAEDLGRETRDLIDVRTDLMAEISNGELQNMEPTQQAKTWLEEVEKIEDRVDKFRVSFQQRDDSSVSCSLSSSYLFAREVAECLKEVRRVQTQKNTLPLLIRAPPPAVVPLPSSSLSIVGEEDTLSEIRRLLEEDEVKIIGIYGMGGIGKTTLLNAINNELHREGTRRFDLVIWVTITKDFEISKVQEDIAVRLGYSRPGEGQGQTLPENATDRVNTLLSALSERTFLLLLDDLWEKLDLGALGVLVKNGSKVVFTTRSEKVCKDMDAQEKVKVPLLNQENSWKLFCQKLGTEEDQWDPSVRSLAEAIAEKCGGLPINLITIGRAMAGATNRHEWKEALKALKSIPAELGDMEKVLIRLKFSFDKLKDTSARECLLYCALFPENYSIDITDLVDYWVGDGLLEKGSFPDSIDKTRKRGGLVITSLKAACLLEEHVDFEGRQVKLPDTVREMALWITRGEGDENGNVFLVNSGERLIRMPTPERWAEARRISLMFNEIGVLPAEPSCGNLETLLLKENFLLREIPCGFFQFMPRLRVLDLSRTDVRLLPPGIGSLVELRFLNLSETSLESLPMEVGRLTKLRQLRLQNTWNLKIIPREAVSSLPVLQSLNMLGSGFVLRGGCEDNGSHSESDHEERQLCLKDLDGMRPLTELGLSIGGMRHEGIRALLNSKRLCESIRFLGLKELGISSFDLSTFLEIMNGVKNLWIEDSIHLKELVFNTSEDSELEDLRLLNLPRATISWNDGIFQNLLHLTLCCCEALEDITWIRQLPSIQTINLRECFKMKELMVVEEMRRDMDYGNDILLAKLEKIVLFKLPNLRSICTHSMVFPSLQIVSVDCCPELKKLPFGLCSAKNIKQIFGTQEWWNLLEWDHEDIGSKFTHYFAPIWLYYEFSKDPKLSCI